MKNRKIRLLLVDDDEGDYLLVREWLSRSGEAEFHLDWVSTYDRGIEAIGRNEHDLYLLDYVLGADNGLALLREAVRKGVQASMILLTGQGNPELQKEAIACGATDYLDKGKVDGALLARHIRQAIQK